MKKKILIVVRIIILLAGLAAAGWAGYVYGLPAFARLQASTQPSTSPAPAAYQTARVRASGGAAAITTSGAVRSNQTTLLTWQTSGTVSRVNGVTGQALDAKTVLAELEQTSLPQGVILARAELVAAKKALDTLLQSTQARAGAQMALVKAQQALDDAQDDRRNKLYQRASPETIDIARARLITANDALDQAEEFFDGHSGDPNSVVYATALSQLAKARQDQIKAQYNLNYVAGLPEPLDIEEADAKIAVTEANVLQAKLDWERVKDGPNEDDVAAAEARVAAAQATLNLARITAPFSGTLTLVNSKPGDQVTAGTPAFQLDDLSHLYLDAAVIEDEIERVQVGQPVTIRFDALPGAEYPGAVTEVGAFGKATAGTVNFTVTVEIQSPGAEIKPGMTASISILTSQAASVLLVPSRAIHTLAGQPVVYLLKDGRPAPVAVAIADASSEDTLVTAGALKAGDLVVLNPEGR
jgi:HlyD family secretion protein